MTCFGKSELNPLKNVHFCRICGEKTESGKMLFNDNKYIERLAVEICSHISVKLKNVPTFPNWICPGCELQFESTSQFFNLIRKGQILIIEKFGIDPTLPRRGRKPKRKENNLVSEDNQALSTSQPTENVVEKRVKKASLKLKDSMQGKELENLYNKLGVTKSLKEVRSKKTRLFAQIETQGGATLGEMQVIPKIPKSITRYQCDICKEKFVKDLHFLEHVASHQNVHFECIGCQKSFSSKALLDEHQVGENHKGLGVIETPGLEPQSAQGDNTLPSRAAQNFSQTLPVKYVCKKCDKSFSTRSSLKRHLSSHSNIRLYSCDMCPASFKRRGVLVIHKLSHSQQRSFGCEKCPKSFVHKQTLKAHLRSHDGVKPYLCLVCGLRFSQLSTLAEHKRVHTGERPFVCLICGAAFKTSSQCRVHQKTHASGQCPEKQKRPNASSMPCKFCGRPFADRSALKKHIRTHTGEKPYKCHLCTLSFADPSNFKKHKKTHENKKKQSKSVATLQQSLTRASSNSDPDPDGLRPTNIIPSDSHTPPNQSIMEIFEDDERNPSAWGLLKESSDPIIAEIHNENYSLSNHHKQPLANQLVCVSYQDPMNPISSKTTFYVVN